MSKFLICFSIIWEFDFLSNEAYSRTIECLIKKLFPKNRFWSKMGYFSDWPTDPILHPICLKFFLGTLIEFPQGYNFFLSIRVFLTKLLKVEVFQKRPIPINGPTEITPDMESLQFPLNQTRESLMMNPIKFGTDCMFSLFVCQEIGTKNGPQ